MKARASPPSTTIGGQQGEDAALPLDGGDQGPEGQAKAQQQPAEIGGMGKGVRRARSATAIRGDSAPSAPAHTGTSPASATAI